MYAYRLRGTTNESTRTTLNRFLGNIDPNNVYILPCNNNAQILAAQSRNGRRVRRLTGKNLMKRNVEREGHRLNVYNRYLINLAVDHIWNLHSTPFQRDRFTSLANNANNINQSRVQRNRLINNA